MTLIGIVSKRINVVADDLSDLEIAVLCDLLDGPGVNLKGHKRAVLNQLVTKGIGRSDQTRSLNIPAQ